VALARAVALVKIHRPPRELQHSRILTGARLDSALTAGVRKEHGALTGRASLANLVANVSATAWSGM
jgi:hypothetical protein